MANKIYKKKLAGIFKMCAEKLGPPFFSEKYTMQTPSVGIQNSI